MLGTSLNPALQSIVTLQVPGRNHLEPSAKQLSPFLAKKTLCHVSPCEKHHHSLYFPARQTSWKSLSFPRIQSWYNTSSVVSPLLSRATVLNQALITVWLGYYSRLLNSSMPASPFTSRPSAAQAVFRAWSLKQQHQRHLET